MIKVRWIVEAVNARIKQFKFLSNTVQNSSLLHLEVYLSIACSIINRYQSPVTAPTPEHVKIGQKMITLCAKEKMFEAVTLILTLKYHSFRILL